MMKLSVLAIRKAPAWSKGVLVALGSLLSVASGSAAGLLSPVGTTAQALRIESHHVDVVINNGFARTEVEQVFFNPNDLVLEAVYEVPVPEKGALSELTIWAGERVLQGEVVSKEEADRIYGEEKAAGNDVGKAEQRGYQRYEFSVYPVPAQGTVRIRYVYYEALVIDTGVGRYSYRIEEGGTDDAAAEAFWSLNDQVESDFSIDVQLKSSWPVARTRTPNYAGVETMGEDGIRRYRWESQGGVLNQDFVFYYMLEENLPGRIEMVTYRENENKPGTFLLLLTPGEDLKRISTGSDYVFVLDVSGSMQGKLNTLVSGVKKAISQLREKDRFRVVAFNNGAWEVTGDWVHVGGATVDAALSKIDAIQSNGGTNVYAGVKLGLKHLDADRVASLILVTDGVTNDGIVDPAAFYKLLHGQDVRFFGFLLGNSSNWPLMRIMCEASGGYYRSVSNNDDIVGEVLNAKNKIVFESMHHAELSIDGVKTFDVGDFKVGKIHFGDQLAFFGRYENAGKAEVRLKARISGDEKVYATEIEFPQVDRSHPELERMWALDQVQKIQVNSLMGLLPATEAQDAIEDIGVQYQIVTDETSMIALDDAGFSRHGMERRNKQRVALEEQARQANPASSGAKRVDSVKPMFSGNSHSYGGGAIDPWFALVVLVGGLLFVVCGYNFKKRN